MSDMLDMGDREIEVAEAFGQTAELGREVRRLRKEKERITARAEAAEAREVKLKKALRMADAFLLSLAVDAPKTRDEVREALRATEGKE